MQHNKITDNLGEFQKFIESDSKTGMCLEDTIRFLYHNSHFSYHCNTCNKCCHGKGIQVNPYEAMRLAECLGISTSDFRS